MNGSKIDEFTDDIISAYYDANLFSPSAHQTFKCAQRPGFNAKCQEFSGAEGQNKHRFGFCINCHKQHPIGCNGDEQSGDDDQDSDASIGIGLQTQETLSFLLQNSSLSRGAGAGFGPFFAPGEGECYPDTLPRPIKAWVYVSLD